MKTALRFPDIAECPVGFGGYRIHAENPAHREALTLALQSGCKLIDTSTNYMDGSSEELIGDVLRGFKRDDVVVVSKAGYIQGSNLQRARKRAFPEMVRYQEGCWHCISPEFLDDQLTRSLERLKLESLDVLLLHNPEYFLKTEDDHPEYYRRIEAAFRYLETEIKRGRIRHYGISSNTFVEPKEASDYTSLETCWEIAQKISEAHHHFSVIQFPFNLFEPGALLERNNSGQTVLEFAQAHGLATLVNRPLNAFNGKKMIRLADFPEHDEDTVSEELKQSFLGCLQMESRYPGKAVVPARELAWGHILKENFEKLGDLENWTQLRAYRIQPQIDQALARLETENAYSGWIAEYRETSERLFDTLTAWMETQASHASQRISHGLEHLLPGIESSPTLSRKVIRLYGSIPGLNCVLVGMRRPEYVRDVMAARAPLENFDAERVFLEMGRQMEKLL